MTDVDPRSPTRQCGALARGGRPDPERSGPLRVATVVARLEGGAGRQVVRGALSLDPDRYAVTLIAGSGEALLDEARESGLAVVVEPTLRAPIRPTSDLRALVALERRLDPSSFDVVHTHCSKAGVLGRVAAHRRGVARIIHTYHGFGFHQYQPAPQRAAYVQIERALGRWTDLALCVGPSVAVEAARRRLVDPSRIRAIGVAVDERFVRASRRPDPGARARARRLLGLTESASVVGAIGRLTYQKAPEDFVALLGELAGRDVVGVWIGDGELAGRVRDLARRRPGVRLVLTGERQDVHELLPAFDVLVLTSRYEGLPTVIVEAMLSGVPVVATAVNAVPDLVDSERTGLLVAPRHPGAAAHAVRRVLADPRLARRLASRARDDVEGSFTIEILRDQLAGAYDTVAPRARRAYE